LFAPQTVVGKPTVVPLRSTARKLSFAVDFSFNCEQREQLQVYLATMSEANNCECNEQL